MTNEVEREQWSGAMGAVWVRRQAELDRLMAAVTTLLLDRAQVRPGARILDVGCGAGASTLAVARATGPEGHVAGQDVAAQLLALARARADAAGLSNVSLAEGDAQTDRAPGGPFDAMISRFGVMFFADPVAAFINIAGQLRPGGRFTFVAWAAAAENPWFALPASVAASRLRSPMPAPPVDPDAPGPTAFRDPARVTGLLARAGLRDAHAEVCDVQLHHPGGPAALAKLGLEVGPAARLLRLHGGEAVNREAVERDLEEAFAPFASADGARVPARVLVYSARAD